MTVKANVPDSEAFSTEGPYCFSAAEIATLAAREANFNGFSGDSCSSCSQTANVLHAQGGWHCTCGHFNFQGYTNAGALHDVPDLGPSQAVIEAGTADAPVSTDEPSGKSCGDCGKCKK